MNRRPPIAKSVTGLSEADFLSFPVWEYATSEEDIERRAYVIGMRHKLADRLRNCECYETIKKIEDALGVNS